MVDFDAQVEGLHIEHSAGALWLKGIREGGLPVARTARSDEVRPRGSQLTEHRRELLRLNLGMYEILDLRHTQITGEMRQAFKALLTLVEQ